MTRGLQPQRVIFTRQSHVCRGPASIDALFQAGMEDATQRETTQEITL